MKAKNNPYNQQKDYLRIGKILEANGTPSIILTFVIAVIILIFFL